ncbi:MAG TPA: hypothetical protein VHD38_00945 [Candidatus Paceibacterota bacterium]|nr:hypothetical protein [Candidatus Paceibacterota bacterium]
MLGYIIINRRNKEGSLYLPEVALQLRACPGGRRDWVDVYPTDGMRRDRKGRGPAIVYADWLKKSHDFVAEIDVPLVMVRFAIEADEKKHSQIDAIGALLEDITKRAPEASSGSVPMPDKTVITDGARRFREIMDAKEPGEISEEKKYAMALQIQRWIHEAGGLC